MKEQHGNFAGTSRHITRKISAWKYQIRRIDKRTEKLNALIKFVNEYFDVKIQSKVMDERHKLARKVFYKYAMENITEGTFVSRSINRVNKHTASEARLKFTRSFKTNHENKIIYHKFLNSLK